MGNSASIRDESELFAFQIMKLEYDHLKKNFISKKNDDNDNGNGCEFLPSYNSNDATDLSIKSRLEEIFIKSKTEYDYNINDCSNPSVILYKYQKLSADELDTFSEKVIDAAVTREKNAHDLAIKNGVKSDYSKGFSGSAADTKAEKDAADLMRGKTEVVVEEVNPYLRRPSFNKEYFAYERYFLRKAGKWRKFMGAGCFMYFHILTKEIASIRPEDYEDEIEEKIEIIDPEVERRKQDISNGLPQIAIADMLPEIDRIINVEKKTPLIIDNSANSNCRLYFSYKAMLEDVSVLTIPFAKSGIKRTDLVEKCRKTLVGAIKTGSKFAFYLGDTSIEHCDWKKKLCKKNTFPSEIFQKVSYYSYFNTFIINHISIYI
jgi:hypothetical protein